jgi:two-component system, LytTR family, sensor histidine kinase AlgZ
VVDHRLTETGGLTHASAMTPEVLPNFCSTETVLRVFVVVGLLALVAVLLRDADDPLIALAPVLIFASWVAFSSLLLLCLVQRWLRRLPLLWKVVIPTLLPVGNTALVHLGAERYFLAASEDRLRVVAVAALLSLIAMRYFYLIAAWQRETRLVAQAREQALRARVRPHFLFNSMNSIAGLCRSDPVRAEQVTLDLADLFRATFSSGATHSLAEELRLVRAYLDIEQTRFGERLALEWDVPPPEQLDLQVPALVLQPLVENAIQHGIAPARDGGKVSVRVTREGPTISIVISNSLGERSGSGTNTAGDEARARLRHCFGARARVEAHRAGGAFVVRVNLPAHAPAGR